MSENWLEDELDAPMAGETTPTAGADSIKRTPRTAETRERNTRQKMWKPPSSLDAPEPPEGFRHKWIRAEVGGRDDAKNISARLREGYELVRKDEYPDFECPVVDSGRYEGVIGVGGLLLARIPEEMVAQRNAYYAGQAQGQQDAVDNDMFRINGHPTMKIGQPERQSRVSFGGRGPVGSD